MNNIIFNSNMFQSSLSTLASGSSVGSYFVRGFLKFFNTLAQNWIWVVIALGIYIFICLTTVITCVCLSGSENSKSKQSKKSKSEMDDNVKVEDKKPELALITFQDMSAKQDDSAKLEQTNENKAVEKVTTQTVDFSGSQNKFANQPGDELWFNLFLNARDDVRDIKKHLERNERDDIILKQDEKLNQMKEELKSQMNKTNELIESQKQNQMQEITRVQEVKPQMIEVDELSSTQKENRLQEKMNQMQEDLKIQVRETVEVVERQKEERLQEKLNIMQNELKAHIREAVGYLEDKREEKLQEKFNQMQEELKSQVKETVVFIESQKEEDLRKKIEDQQKELEALKQERIDELKQEQLAEKMAEILALQKKVEDLQNEVKKNEELSVNSFDETNKVVAYENNEQNIVENKPALEENKKKDFFLESKDVFEIEDNKTASEDKEIGDDKKIVSKDAITIEAIQKFSIKEAYEQLSYTQKKYFTNLVKYAKSKPNAKVKEAKGYIRIGNGNKTYIQLAIKKNTVIACFSLESEELLRLRLEGETTVKPDQTKIKIVNEEALNTAIKMIDVRVQQVEREVELIKELRKEKQKLRYERIKTKK